VSDVVGAEAEVARKMLPGGNTVRRPVVRARRLDRPYAPFDVLDLEHAAVELIADAHQDTAVVPRADREHERVVNNALANRRPVPLLDLRAGHADVDISD
jgi:hypothetical protein